MSFRWAYMMLLDYVFLVYVIMNLYNGDFWLLDFYTKIITLWNNCRFNIYQQAMQQFKAILVKKQKQTMHCTLPSDVGFSGPIEDCCYQYYDYWANYLLNFCYLIFHPRPLWPNLLVFVSLMFYHLRTTIVC